jgi:hypothetical protein
MADEVTRVDQTVTTSNVQPVVPASTVQETTTTTTTQTAPAVVPAAPQAVNVNVASTDTAATESVSVDVPGYQRRNNDHHYSHPGKRQRGVGR